MEKYFATLFEDIRHEHPLTLLLSLTDDGIRKQARIMDPELNLRKSCLRKATQAKNS